MGNIGRADSLSAKNQRRLRARSAAAQPGMTILKDLSSALESVLFLVETAGGPKPDVTQGIDFYDEVRDFEISLIRQALRETHGNQVRAAVLLNLNPTTLNAKIKQYSIDSRVPSCSGELAGSLRVAND